jgi:hypothetical protein
MENYNEKKQSKYALIRRKLLEEARPKTVLISSIKDDIKRNKRTKKG